jgi:DNA polymerase-3 subunit delta'
MAWNGILGHDDVVAQFRRVLQRGRLGSSFLFVGPEGIGKRRFALGLAQALLCSVRDESLMDPCGTCPTCVQVRALTHPDLDYVCKPEDKAYLPVELLVGERETRGREGLCYRLSMKPFMGGRKVAIIDDADYLNAEGANSLLKTLEEPPPRSMLILIGTSPAKQLPTIRSRCQIIRFRPLDSSIVSKILLDNGLVDRIEDAQRLAQLSEGSVRRATELADPGLWKLRQTVWKALGQPQIDCLGLSAEILRFAEQSGRDGAARRESLRQAIGAATEYYQRLLRSACSVSLQDDALEAIRSDSMKEWPHQDFPQKAKILVQCIERCLDAAGHVDRNVYPAILIECWLDDLASLWLVARGGGKSV